VVTSDSRFDGHSSPSAQGLATRPALLFWLAAAAGVAGSVVAEGAPLWSTNLTMREYYPGGEHCWTVPYSRPHHIGYLMAGTALMGLACGLLILVRRTLWQRRRFELVWLVAVVVIGLIPWFEITQWPSRQLVLFPDRWSLFAMYGRFIELPKGPGNSWLGFCVFVAIHGAAAAIVAGMAVGIRYLAGRRNSRNAASEA
jgi:hypothetical protein